jgi:hypothetical protein
MRMALLGGAQPGGAPLRNSRAPDSRNYADDFPGSRMRVHLPRLRSSAATFPVNGSGQAAMAARCSALKLARRASARNSGAPARTALV